MTAKKEDTTDPYEDPTKVARSFPNRVDQTGTPDTQPDQPAGALGVGQVSSDSIKKEADALQDLADKSSGNKSGLVEVSKEDQAKAVADVKDGSEIEGGHPDAQKDQLKSDLERAKEADAARKDQSDEEKAKGTVPASSQETVEKKPASKK